MKHWQWGLVIVGLLGGAASLFWATNSTNDAMPPSTTVAAHDDWPVGMAAHYEIEWESVALAEQVELETQAPERKVMSRLTLKGAMQLTRLPGPQPLVILHAVLLAPSLKIEQENARTLELEKNTRKELQQPFLIELNRHGLVERVKIPDDIGSTAFGVFKSIAALLQRARGEEGETKWSVIEADLSGQAELSYRLQGTTLTKEKLNYVTLVHGTGVGAQATRDAEVSITESEHVHELGDGWLAPARLINVDEGTRVELGGAFAPMTSEVHLNLSLDHTSSLKNDALTELAEGRFTATRLDQLPSEEAQRRELEQQSVNGRSVENLTKAIVELEQQQPRDRRTEARIFSALTSKMRIDAQARDEAEKRVRDNQNRMLMLDALGSAGTPETQALLVKLITEVDLGREQTRSSLINLSMSEEPTDATIEALRERTDDPSHGTQATYGLGSAAYHLRDSRPQESLALVQELILRLETAADNSEKGVLLRSLGNTGSSLALDSCETYIVAPSLPLRNGAADCARLIAGPRAEAVLAKALLDPEETVVKTALNAALHRSYSTQLIKPILDIASGERTKHLRVGALRVLVVWMNSQPNLVAEVRTIASQESDEDIRRYLEKKLAALN